MSKIVLIRHGQSEYNIHKSASLDSALTEKGISQVEETAHNLKKIIKKWDCKPSGITCWTSPYLRCLQTAEIIQKELGVSFKVDNVWLRETMITYDKVTIPCRRIQFSRFDWSMSRGFKDKLAYWTEHGQEYTRRIEACKRQIERWPFFIGVSHGTPITDLINLFAGTFTQPSLDKYVDNASINLIETKNEN